MSEQPQQVNSLERFRKRSARLLLEVHGSCEVPAGCGGVVLRWRNPHEARPLLVRFYTAAPCVCWLDGEPLERGRVDLRPGRHVVAFEIEEVDRAAGLLMAALTHDPEDANQQVPPGVREAPLRILSVADGTWKCTFEPPGEGWASLEFDDGAWDALAGRDIPEVDWAARAGYQWHACRDQGAAGLGVGRVPPGLGPRGRVWVRKVFDVPAPASL